MNARAVVRAGGAAALALALTAACAPYGLGSLEDILGGFAGIEGEVRGVSSRQLSIRDDYSRNHTLRVNRRTVVVQGENRYPVSALERGDWVRATYTTDDRGTRWAERVEVRQSVRDGSRRSGGVSRLEGRVSGVDSRRGHFQLDQGRAGSILIHVPPRVSRDAARRFERLRSGERVRVDVRPLTRSEAELIRFR